MIQLCTDPPLSHTQELGTWEQIYFKGSELLIYFTLYKNMTLLTHLINGS